MNTLIVTFRMSREAKVIHNIADNHAINTFSHVEIDPAHYLYAALLRPNSEPAPRELRGLGLKAELALNLVKSSFLVTQQKLPTYRYNKASLQMFERASGYADARGPSTAITVAELVGAAVTSSSDVIRKVLGVSGLTSHMVLDKLKLGM